MKIRPRLAVVACLAFAFSHSVPAQGRSPLDQGYWRPASNTAHSITGDIAFTDAKITIGFNSYVIAQIRALRPAEAGAAFDADTNAPGNGNLYRTNIPAGKRFLHHNTLCGSDDTQWVATWVTGNTLQVAFFSGEKMPLLTLEALPNSTNLCGTYNYTR
jgi:hypothetical protein